MIIEINQLKKIIDLINSEGTILGLLKDKKSKLYLCSFLINGEGTVYYSTTKKTLNDYLLGKLKTKELFLKSNSFLVTIKNKNNSKVYIKENIGAKIQCSEKYYTELPKSMTVENPCDNIG